MDNQQSAEENELEGNAINFSLAALERLIILIMLKVKNIYYCFSIAFIELILV